MLNKLIDYFLPLLGGIILIVFALLGYKKAKRLKKERQNIMGLLLGILLIVSSLCLCIFF
jgi:hypothetical protein